MPREPSIDELIEQLKLVRIQEATIIEQIEEQVRANEAQAMRAGHVRTTPPVLRGVYTVGDRVRVTNGVREGQLPTGTVTRITRTRVYIRTDDGSDTWRKPGNLTHLL